jgi:hypothetical protein
MKKSGWSNKTKALRKVGKVMHEFKEGTLHSGKSDKVVKNPKQAIAIALSEAGLSKKETGGGVVNTFYALTSNGMQNKTKQKIQSISYWKGKQSTHKPTSENINEFLSQVPFDEKICIYTDDDNSFYGQLHSAHVPLYTNGAESVDAIVDNNNNIIWNKYAGSKYEIKIENYKMATGGGVDGYVDSVAFDKLKKGDKIKITYGSAIQKGNEKQLLVKSKTVVGKGKSWESEKITFANLDNPTGVKYFAYKRKDGDVGFAIGDMAIWGVKIIKEFAEGGGVDEQGIDLFEDYENIPENVQNILDKYEDDFVDGNYSGLEKASNELKKIGYTFEYYLDGQAYDLRPIGTKGKSEVEEYANGGSVGDSGTITDKNSMFFGKMGTITGDLGDMYEVMVLNNGNKRTVLVKKNGISIVSDEYAKGGGVGESNNNFKEIDGNKYFSYDFENKGNKWGVLISWGKYNHVNVTKKTNNPFGYGIGKEFSTIGEAVDNYKDVNIKSNILFAANMAKEYGYEPKYADGGAIDINDFDMPVIRSQFEEEEFEFGNGGAIYSRTMRTPDGTIVGKVQYNDFWKTYQVVIDGTVYEEFKTKEEAMQNLKNAGFDKMALGGGVSEDIKIKDWYTKEYSSDDMGKELNDDSTFKDLENAIFKGNNVYSVLGVSDSVVRERAFAKLSKMNNKEGQWAYNNWLMYSDKMARGGGVESENRDMVLNNNKQIAHHTKEMSAAVRNSKYVPAWVVAKVNRSATDLSDATHYMEGEGESYANGGGVMENIKQKMSEMNIALNTKTEQVYVGGIKPENRVFKDEKGYYLVEGYGKFMGKKYPIKKHFTPSENEVLDAYMQDKYAKGGNTGGTSDSAEMNAPTLGGTMTSSMAKGGAVGPQIAEIKAKIEKAKKNTIMPANLKKQYIEKYQKQLAALEPKKEVTKKAAPKKAVVKKAAAKKVAPKKSTKSVEPTGGRTERGLVQDKERLAKKAGKRISESGGVYYENRENRSDKNRKTRLEDGGTIKGWKHRNK